MRCDYSCNGCDSERKLPAPRGFGEHTIEPNVRGQFEKRIEFHTITEGHADECQHHQWRDRQTNQWRNDKTWFWHAPRFQKVQKCISHQPDKKRIRGNSIASIIRCWNTDPKKFSAPSRITIREKNSTLCRSRDGLD